MYDVLMASSYRRRASASKAVTVRVPVALLKKVMRARKAATQSELINELLTEAEERIEAEAVLRETSGAAASGGFDDRLL